jgi:uracil-DNA glycosylase
MDKSTRGADLNDFDSLPLPWRLFLGQEICDELELLRLRLSQAGPYYPKGSLLRAFHFCSPAQVKAVVVGQDPYHGEGEANGLAFSFEGQGALPPSLRNIYKELREDLAWATSPSSGDLAGWAQSGVLLLNSILSVKPNEAGSHAYLGWEEWTEKVLARLSSNMPGIVFILWGAKAHKKALMFGSDVWVIKGTHPSPLSANRGGFFGGKYFSKANALRAGAGMELIDWELIRHS